LQLPHPGIRQADPDETAEQAGDPVGGGILGLDPLQLVGQGTFGQRPEDLHQELLASADPPVQGSPVDTKFTGQAAHVHPLPVQEAPLGQRERVHGGSPASRGACLQLPLQHRLVH